MGGVQWMSIDATTNEPKKPEFHERDLQHICAGHNSENGRTCEHICLFVDNRDWNAPIVLRMRCMMRLRWVSRVWCDSTVSHASIHEPFLNNYKYAIIGVLLSWISLEWCVVRMKNVYNCVHACVKGCHGWVDDGVDDGVDELINVGRFPPDVNPKSHTMGKKLNCFFLGGGWRQWFIE